MFREQEVERLRELCNEKSNLIRVMKEDIKALRKAVVILGKQLRDIETTEGEREAARCIFMALAYEVES